MAYARTKVKEALAKKAAADHPDLFVGKDGVGAAASQIQPKLTQKGAINLMSLSAWRMTTGRKIYYTNVQHKIFLEVSHGKAIQGIFIDQLPA